MAGMYPGSTYYGPRTKNPNLSDEMRGLLDSIASTESNQKRPDGGYGQAYHTNTTFKVDDPSTYQSSGPIDSGPYAPQNNHGKITNSSAKGRYQFLNSTLAANAPIDPATGYPSLREADQDAAAANNATANYNRIMGRNLENDLTDPARYDKIGSVLGASRQWTSLPSGIEQSPEYRTPGAWSDKMADRIKNYTDRTYVATASPQTLAANSMAPDSMDRFNARQENIDARTAPAPPSPPSLISHVASDLSAPFSMAGNAISSGWNTMFGAPAKAPAPAQPMPIGAPVPQSKPQPTAPQPPTSAPMGIGSLGAPAPFGMPAQASMAPSPQGIGGLTSPSPVGGPQTISTAPAPLSMPSRPASMTPGETGVLGLARSAPWGPAPSPATSQPAPAPSTPPSLFGGTVPSLTGNPAQNAPQLQGIQGAPTPSAPAPVNGSGPYMASDLANMDASEQARMNAARTAPAPVSPQPAPSPQITKMPTAPAPAPMSMSQVSQQAVNAQPPASAVQGLQGASPQAPGSMPTPQQMAQMNAVPGALANAGRAVVNGFSPMLGIAPTPSPVMNAPTPLNPVAPQTPANQPTYDPQQTTATPAPTTMQTVKGIGKTAANIGKAGLLGVRGGGLVGGVPGAVIGGGLGLAGGIGNAVMDHYNTNINNLFGGPRPNPGSAPATQADVVANAAPSVLSQVNRMDYGPAPTGYHYGYSPFGNNISAISNNASEASQIAGTGPGILGAFGFGTSNDGYNNGPTNSPAAQQAAGKVADAANAASKAKQKAQDAANSQSNSPSGSKPGNNGSNQGGGSGANMGSTKPDKDKHP